MRGVSVMTTGSKVLPANIWKRVFANTIDTVCALVIIYTISTFQKDSPPPTGMSFYTQQQFENYFALVFVACLIVLLNGLLMLYSPLKKTIGHLVFNLSLVSLNGETVTNKQILSRTIRTLGSVLFISIPGPVIALFIALAVGGIFSVPFSTGDRMIVDAGIPDPVRYLLHGISYLALFVATWMVIIQPLIKVLLGLKDGITSRDRATQSTYIEVTEAPENE